MSSNHGDQTWHLVLFKSRLQVIEQVENLTFHIPGMATDSGLQWCQALILLALGYRSSTSLICPLFNHCYRVQTAFQLVPRRDLLLDGSQRGRRLSSKVPE